MPRSFGVDPALSRLLVSLHIVGESVMSFVPLIERSNFSSSRLVIDGTWSMFYARASLAMPSAAVIGQTKWSVRAACSRQEKHAEKLVASRDGVVST